MTPGCLHISFIQQQEYQAEEKCVAEQKRERERTEDETDVDFDVKGASSRSLLVVAPTT